MVEPTTLRVITCLQLPRFFFSTKMGSVNARSLQLATIDAISVPEAFCTIPSMKHTKSAHTFLIYQHLHTHPLSESPIQPESTPLTTSQETIDPISVPEANWHGQVDETRQQRFYFLHITNTYPPIYSASPQSNGKVPYLLIYSPPRPPSPKSSESSRTSSFDFQELKPSGLPIHTHWITMGLFRGLTRNLVPRESR